MLRLVSQSLVKQDAAAQVMRSMGLSLQTLLNTTPLIHELGGPNMASTSYSSCVRMICTSGAQMLPNRWRNDKDKGEAKLQWQALVSQTHNDVINPCNSKLHPAVVEGVLPAPVEGEEVCVQEAYTPHSTCFGCGPAAPEGLQLQSRRVEGGLEAIVRIPPKYCAFPGIVNGGIIGTLLDCHGNWTSAIALMDKGCLPRPPLTLTRSINLTYKEPTPPDVDLVIRSKVISIKDSTQPGMGKASVEVETSVYQRSEDGSPMKLLVTAHGLHKRLGALRAL